MLKHIRDSEQGIGNFCMQNPNNEKFVGQRGLDDHGRSKALSGSLTALTIRWSGVSMDSKEFSKIWHHEARLGPGLSRELLQVDANF